MAVVDLLRAAGEPTRLRILSLLRGGEVCVCELQARLQLPQSTISRHLAPLRHAGLIVAARKGTRVFYSIGDPSTPQHRAFLRFLDVACPPEMKPRRDRVRPRPVGWTPGRSRRGPGES